MYLYSDSTATPAGAVLGRGTAAEKEHRVPRQTRRRRRGDGAMLRFDGAMLRRNAQKCDGNGEMLRRNVQKCDGDVEMLKSTMAMERCYDGDGEMLR